MISSVLFQILTLLPIVLWYDSIPLCDEILFLFCKILWKLENSGICLVAQSSSGKDQEI